MITIRVVSFILLLVVSPIQSYRFHTKLSKQEATTKNGVTASEECGKCVIDCLGKENLTPQQYDCSSGVIDNV